MSEVIKVNGLNLTREVQAAQTAVTDAEAQAAVAEGHADDAAASATAAASSATAAETSKNQAAAIALGDAEEAFDGFLAARDLPADGSDLSASTVQRTTVDVNVCLGQSGATPKGSQVGAGINGDPLQQVLWYSHTEDLIKTESGTGASVVQWLGNEFARRRRVKTGRDQMVVRCAVGDTSYKPGGGYSWDPDDTTAATNLYNQAVSRTQAALAKLAADGKAPGRMVVLLDLGQRDSGQGTTQAEFEAYTDKLISRWRTTFGSNVAFILRSLVPDWVGRVPSRIAIQKAILDTPQRNSRVSVVLEPQNLFSSAANGGTIHISPAGEELMAAQVEDAYHRALRNVAGIEPLQPPAIRMWRQADDVHIEWDPSPNRALGYRCEISVDSGPWTQVTQDYDTMATFCDTKVPATSPVRVRVRSYNTVGDSLWTSEYPPTRAVNAIGIPGAIRRWDADLLTAPDDTVITYWRSEEANPVQLIGSATLKTDSTRRYLRFNGVDQRLYLNPLGFAPKTIAVLCRTQVAPTSSTALFSANPLIYFGNLNGSYTVTGGGGTDQINSPGEPPQAWAWRFVSLDGTNKTVSSGDDTAVVRASTDTFTQLHLGYNFGSSAYQAVDVGALAMFDFTVTDQNRVFAMQMLSQNFPDWVD